MNMTLFLQGGPLPPAGPPPLLATTGTELLEFAVLIAAGVWMARRAGVSPVVFVRNAFLLVTAFFLLWPQEYGPQHEADRVVMNGMASLVAGLMNMGGTEASVDGISVMTSVRFTMARGCMGLTYLAMAAFCALSFPASWRRRLTAAAGIAAGMVLLNALRILTLYHLWQEGYHGVHTFVHRVGGALFAAFALGLFVVAFKPRLVVEKQPAVEEVVPGVRAGEATSPS
jgi:exosortase/archaeosortase family protein